MNMKQIISKKKYKQKLTEEEIQFFVHGFTKGEIPDYQMSALLMAIYFNSMDSEEIAQLTKAMVDSGDTVDLSMIEGIKVDKHSTGGVGDKISLIVIPIIAALGIPVAKMSGRGLGHTGGTIDKLEAIPGFRVELSAEEFIQNVKTYGMALVGQSGNLTPADKKIYALRDATECVDSIPLISSSIMSKKIASGTDAIVLDVKVGKGAFMKSEKEARVLARAMVDIGNSLGRKTVAILTAMDQPLGRQVGNANELMEAIEVLSGKGEEDETQVAVEISSYMALLGGKFHTLDEARSTVREIISSGKGLEKLKVLIKIQGGDPSLVDHPSDLLKNTPVKSVFSEEDGYISALDAEAIGKAAMLLGAGRATKEDVIDHQAGVSLIKKIGEKVGKGEEIFKMYSNRPFDEAEAVLKSAYSITKESPQSLKYIYGVVE